LLRVKRQKAVLRLYTDEVQEMQQNKAVLNIGIAIAQSAQCLNIASPI